ncbi:hypothetical protein BSKO_09096 [Bryopsis sp. KO-2023]|nr:hypothetical protein BSKO_09096 [Bryopsis sp. KO-2023]
MQSFFSLAVCFFLVASLTFASGDSLEESSQQTVTLDGRISSWGGHLRNHRDTRIIVTLDGGREIVSFVRKDGSFRVNGLPPGMHMLDVVASNWHFPQIKLDVSSRGDAGIRAHYAENRQALPIPLELRAQPISHFERRKAFSLWGFITSRMGLTICAMLFGVIVIPMMKVDPEEYKQMKEMWNQPSGANQQAPALQGRYKRE